LLVAIPFIVIIVNFFVPLLIPELTGLIEFSADYIGFYYLEAIALALLDIYLSLLHRRKLWGVVALISLATLVCTFALICTHTYFTVALEEANLRKDDIP
jgi:hypothetical protein